MPTSYLLYARKSTEDEDRQVMSIEAQLCELNEFAQREQITVTEQFIERQSAKRPGRKIFNEMVHKINRSREPVGILAWHPDRLARNSVDGGQIIYLIDTGKLASLRFPQFWFEPTPQGLFMLQIAFGQSKYFSDNLSENVKRGMREKLRHGEWLARAPFGYINNHQTKTIEPDPTKAPLVARAFESFATGNYTLNTLAELMATWGIMSRNGQVLRRSQIEHMLLNPAYIGMISHGNQLFHGTFPGIVSQIMFEIVQRILSERSRKRDKKTFSVLEALNRI